VNHPSPDAPRQVIRKPLVRRSPAKGSFHDDFDEGTVLMTSLTTAFAPSRSGQLPTALALMAILVSAGTLTAQGAPPLAQEPRPNALPKQASLPKDLGTRKAGVDWPDFLGPNRDARSSETGILTKWPAAGPRIVWQRELADGYAGPVISRGRLFQVDQREGKSRLFALHSETGKELWKFEYPSAFVDLLGYDNGPRCCAVVDGDRVYIFGAEGILHCLRVNDGHEVWKLDTAKEFGVVQNFFGVGSAPLVEGELLIVQIGGSPADSPETYSGRVQGNGSGIVAFDKHTGKVKYKLTDELASYASPVARTINGRRWCFVFARGGLVAFDPANGKLDFHYPWRARSLESVNASNPVIVGDEVLISECYEIGASLLKLKPGGYDVVWKDGRKRKQSLATHWNTPIYHDGYVYGSSGRNTSDAELHCVEWKTGKVAWSEPGLTRASLLYADGHFICQCEDGVLRLIAARADKYEEVAKAELTIDGEPLLNFPAWAAPVLSHGLLYVRGKDRLVCLELIPAKP
jgi:outer membrane protein assembly factor BamB